MKEKGIAAGIRDPIHEKEPDPDRLKRRDHYVKSGSAILREQHVQHTDRRESDRPQDMRRSDLDPPEDHVKESRDKEQYPASIFHDDVRAFGNEKDRHDQYDDR